MGNMYLIPANSKKSSLIFGIFNNIDLIIFATGVSITVILMMMIQATSLVESLILLSPALVVSFLVFPLPNYHNVMQLIINIYTFYFVNQSRYIWKGWCYKNGNKE